MSEWAVRAQGLGKRFLVLKSRRTSLRAVRALLSGQSLRRELWVLRELSFEIPRGAKLALLGRNGSGKTTLLRILAGILEPSHGRIDLRARPRPLFRAEVGFIPDLSVLENVLLFGAVHGISRASLVRRMPALLEATGLTELTYVPLKDLSTGQIQRLALAVFAESEADLVILDEVIGNVDHGFLRAADHYFRRLSESSRTVIMTSHDTSFLRTYCTSALWLADGRVRLHGGFEAVVREYEESFAGAAAPTLARGLGG